MTSENSSVLFKRGYPSRRISPTPKRSSNPFIEDMLKVEKIKSIWYFIENNKNEKVKVPKETKVCIEKNIDSCHDCSPEELRVWESI